MDRAALLAVLLIALASCAQALVLRLDRCCRFRSCAFEERSRKCRVTISCDPFPRCLGRSSGDHLLPASACDSENCTKAGVWCWSGWYVKSSGCYRIRHRECCEERQRQRISDLNCRGLERSTDRSETEKMTCRTRSYYDTNFRRLVGIVCSVVLLLILLGVFCKLWFKTCRRQQQRIRPFAVEGLRSDLPPSAPVDPVLPPSYEEASRTAQPPPPAYEEAVRG